MEYIIGAIITVVGVLGPFWLLGQWLNRDPTSYHVDIATRERDGDLTKED
jgi:hypothetical protein